MDLCRVGTTSIRKRCVAAIWNMTNVEQVAHGGGSAAESIPMLLVRKSVLRICQCYRRNDITIFKASFWVSFRNGTA